MSLERQSSERGYNTSEQERVRNKSVVKETQMKRDEPEQKTWRQKRGKYELWWKRHTTRDRQRDGVCACACMRERESLTKGFCSGSGHVECCAGGRWPPSLRPSRVVWPSFSLSLHLYDGSVYSVGLNTIYGKHHHNSSRRGAARCLEDERDSLSGAAHHPVCSSRVTAVIMPVYAC